MPNEEKLNQVRAYSLKKGKPTIIVDVNIDTRCRCHARDLSAKLPYVCEVAYR